MRFIDWREERCIEWGLWYEWDKEIKIVVNDNDWMYL